ncbi:MAG: CPBP family intramembrane metalloprotease [Balneola sp.]|nr:CPBP family intramembrane metalloprotease [Balneola sp.]MBO6712200.1 CPBP family intramembrane metalloprotease [Balneola sp.]MBO6800394.1 CPBP family intramembrane metalloprotease [Balneola sp.]MBO6871814.1 CPBP family intramembrane metalloprotease [Balneola sp.]
MENAVKTYFSDSKNLLYSFLISLPLFLAYELLILISQPETSQIVRISVDSWFKSVFSLLGVNTVSITLLIVALFGMYILYKEREQLRELRFKYFPIMIGESTLYAILVTMVATFFVSMVFAFSANDPISSLTGLQKFALSLGAGLYEELFFRVILVSVLILVFQKVFNNKNWAAITAAVILSAFLFSMVHYVGSMGDPFTFSSFTYRFLFGLMLNGIYVWRGFGIAAWTHALYDLMVLFII